MGEPDRSFVLPGTSRPIHEFVPRSQRNDVIDQLVGGVDRLGHEQRRVLIDRLLPRLDRASLSYMARESSRRCKVDFVAELPFPVVHHLLGFLPLETLAIMKRVGRAWYNIMPPVWLTGCARLGVPVYEDSDPATCIYRLQRCRRRHRQMCRATSVLYNPESVDPIVVAVKPDLTVAHPYFCVHLPASSTDLMRGRGHILVKPSSHSSLLQIHSDDNEGSQSFLETGMPNGPSCVTSAVNDSLVMAFPDGTVQKWSWRLQQMTAESPGLTSPMGRCVDYAPIWDLVVVGCDDGTVNLCRLETNAQLAVLQEPDTFGCPAIAVRLIARSTTSATGALSIRMFAAVTHQTGQVPIVHSTSVCSFACLRIYEVCSDINGQIYCQTLLTKRTESWGVGVKTSLTIRQNPGMFCWLTVDYPFDSVYTGDESQQAFINEYDPVDDLLTTSPASFNATDSQSTPQSAYVSPSRDSGISTPDDLAVQMRSMSSMQTSVTPHGMREWTLMSIGEQYATIALVSTVSSEHHSAYIVYERIAGNNGAQWVQKMCIRHARPMNDPQTEIDSKGARSVEHTANAFSSMMSGDTQWLDGLDGLCDYGMLFGGFWYDFAKGCWQLRRMSWSDM